jgi:predicted nucleic acid-binding protein
VADYLFDTTVFIDYHGGDPEAKHLVERLFEGSISASYCALTLAELWIGISTISEEELRRKEEVKYEALFKLMESAPISDEDAKLAGILLGKFVGKLDEKARKEFLKEFLADAIVGAVASRRGEVVCTRNKKHFEQFSVEAETY